MCEQDYYLMYNLDLDALADPSKTFIRLQQITNSNAVESLLKYVNCSKEHYMLNCH